MLPNLVKVEQGILQPLQDGGHATKSSPLQLLALEQRLGVLEKADIVAGDRFDEVLCRRDLAKGNLEMVRIVKSVEKISVERVDVVEYGEGLLNAAELFAEGLLCELDLPGVETSDSADLETSSDLCGQPSLGATEDDIEKLLGSRHRGNILRKCMLISDCQVRAPVRVISTYFPGSLGRHLEDLSGVDAVCVCSRNEVAGKHCRRYRQSPELDFSGPLKSLGKLPVALSNR